MIWQERTSFVFNLTNVSDYEDMTREELGLVLEALIRFARTGEESIDTSDRFIRSVFRAQISAMKSNWEKYDEQCARNKANGAKGGRPRKGKGTSDSDDNHMDSDKTEVNPQKPSGFSEKPKKADKDKEQDKDLDLDKEKEKEEDKDSKEHPLSFLLYPCSVPGVPEIAVKMVNRYISASHYSYLTEESVNEVYQGFADGAYVGLASGLWRAKIDSIEERCRQQSLEKMREEYSLPDAIGGAYGG